MNRNFPIRSRFRNEFFMQITALVLLVAGGVLYLLLSDIAYPFGWLLAIVIAVVGLVFLYVVFLKKMVQIDVDEKGVRFRNLLSGKEKTVAYEDLKKIDTGMFQIENMNGPLTEGVPEVFLYDKEGNEYYISPSLYANFYDLVRAILDGHNRMTDKKLDILARAIFEKITKR